MTPEDATRNTCLMAAGSLLHAIGQAGVSFSDVDARCNVKIGTCRDLFDELLSGVGSVHIGTLALIAHAIGYQWVVQLSPMGRAPASDGGKDG